MCIVIKADKKMKHGQPFFVLKSLKLLSIDNVPSAYLNSEQRVYLNNDVFHVVDETIDNFQMFELGEFIPKHKFEQLLVICRKAGNNLMKINKKLKAEKKLKEWSGETVVKI